MEALASSERDSDFVMLRALAFGVSATLQSIASRRSATAVREIVELMGVLAASATRTDTATADGWGLRVEVLPRPGGVTVRVLAVHVDATSRAMFQPIFFEDVSIDALAVALRNEPSLDGLVLARNNEHLTIETCPPELLEDGWFDGVPSTPSNAPFILESSRCVVPNMADDDDDSDGRAAPHAAPLAPLSASNLREDAHSRPTMRWAPSPSLLASSASDEATRPLRIVRK
jgi:hypothetical protein